MRDTNRLSTLVYSTIPVILLYAQNPMDPFEAVGPFIYIYDFSHMQAQLIKAFVIIRLNYRKVLDRQTIFGTTLKLLSMRIRLRFSVACIQPSIFLCNTLVN